MQLGQQIDPLLPVPPPDADDYTLELHRRLAELFVSTQKAINGVIPYSVTTGQALLVDPTAQGGVAWGAGSFIVLSPAYAATVTVDLTNYAAYAAIIVNVGTLTGNITFDITNGTDGQVIRVWFTQDGTGSRIFTAGSHLAFSTDTPSPTLTTTASKVDSLGFQWRSAEAKALMVAVNHGFA